MQSKHLEKFNNVNNIMLIVETLIGPIDLD